MTQKITYLAISNRERVVNSTRGTLEEVNIQSLRPGARYVLRVVAYNENGAGDSSAPLTVRRYGIIIYLYF